MRSWYPISVKELDDKRLRGEHAELHCLNSVILNNKKGYSKHPETLRWVGHTKAMQRRHDEIEAEMLRRGMKPKSPMKCIETDSDGPPKFWEPLEVMIKKLRDKQK